MALPFSESYSSNGFIFFSGQIHLDENGKLLDGSIEDQTHQVMRNIQKVLDTNGITFSNVVKATIYIIDMSLYQQVNDVYVQYFSGKLPAREMIGVKELPLGARLEISVIAAKN